MEKLLSDPSEITVLVLDDYPLMRLGIFASLLNTRYKVVGLENRTDIAALLEKHRPGVAIIGADLGDLKDRRFFKSVSASSTSSVIFLTEAVVALAGVRRCTKVVRGMLHRQAPAAELIACLDHVSWECNYVSRRLGTRPDAAVEAAGDAQPLSRLSMRETEVLRLIQLGLSNRLIADKLGISRETVSVHLRAIGTKLGVRNRTRMAIVGLTLEGSLGAWALRSDSDVQNA